MCSSVHMSVVAEGVVLCVSFGVNGGGCPGRMCSCVRFSIGWFLVLMFTVVGLSVLWIISSLCAVVRAFVRLSSAVCRLLMDASAFYL